MGKTLNTNSITNELENSSFFPGRPAQNREEEESRERKNPVSQLDVVEPVKPAPQPVISQLKESARKAVAQPASPAPAASRRYVRRTFDFYEDQIAYLLKASLEDKLAGGEGSMNAMVREAIDSYIAKRSKK
jgi:hypothetical protein